MFHLKHYCSYFYSLCCFMPFASKCNRFAVGAVCVSAHCSGRLSVKWLLELNCACWYMTFNVCIFPALAIALLDLDLCMRTAQICMYGNSTAAILMRVMRLSVNILFLVLGYDDVSETNLRSYSVHSAKHVQENRPVPIRRKRSIGKQWVICT